ncbi:MAG TPA: hypothetical protein VIU35_02475 [Chitinophagaceae bacterium]
MKRIIFIWLYAICLFFVITSCKQNQEKKELWAPIIDFFSPDMTYYPDNKKFPFPDSLRFVSLESFFTNQGKKPILTDSMIIFFDNYRVNGQKLCCKKDTLEFFIDSIKGKKYLFVIGEYITVVQCDNNVDTDLRTRKTPGSIPLWGIQLNVAYPVAKFKEDYEKLGAKYVEIDPRNDEVSRQKWNENDSILVETIQFNNSTDRIITAVQKDMNENEMNAIIEQLKNKYPTIKYEEALQKDDDGNPFKVIRMNFQGISISFKQTGENKYSFMITDYYETLKLIINNSSIGYIFRDDVKFY